MRRANQQHGRQRSAQILHESSLKQQTEHQAAGVCPPEGTSYWEPPLPEGLQLFLLAFVAEDADFTGTLWHRMTTHDATVRDMTKHFWTKEMTQKKNKAEDYSA